MVFNYERKQKARLALAELEKEMEILTKEQMNACKGGGSEDIIILFATEAVSIFGGERAGHTAVLIGNNDSGWVYYSSNGTDEGKTGFSGREKGDIRPFKSLEEFKNANKNGKLRFDYNESIHIKTTVDEDCTARIAAYESVTDGYHLFKSSCLDVSRNVVNAVLEKRGRQDYGGNHMNMPNNYLSFLKKKYNNGEL